MLFRKCGCLVAHEKCIFRKCFSVLMCLWCKLISVFILPSNTIFRKTERERECASEIAPARKERERERERKKRKAIAGDPRASTLSATHRLRATNPELRLRIAPQTQSFDFESHPLTLPANPEARIAVWLRVRIAPIDFAGAQRPGSPFDFEFESHPLTSPANPEARIAVRLQLRWHRSHWVRDWEIAGFWWIWPGLMIFFLLGFDEFNRICVNLLKICIIYLFGSWENVRKCKKQ